MGRRELAFVLLASLGALFSCSTTPRHEGHTGLFDRLMESKHRLSRGPKPVPLTETERSQIQALTAKWSRPLESAIVNSEFGPRDGRLHEGIDLKARTGTKVFAAAPGRVLYASARIKGYGRMIVIDHGQHLATVYAHLSKALVAEGQDVRRGQLIAKSGATGRVTGPHLHFELRYGTAAIDPDTIVSARFYRDIPPAPKHQPVRAVASQSKKKKKKRI